MKDILESSLNSLFGRIPKIGKKATVEEIASINHYCNGIIPDWYEEVLINYPICGVELGWQQFEEEEDFDEINWMEFSNLEMMRSEMFDCYPGIAIYKLGYLNVASCLHGSGDPYFIDTKEGSNPRVLQIYHDISENPETIIKEGIEVVADSLSEFFQNCKIVS